MPEPDNNRVTLAVVQRDIQHLRTDVEQWRHEMRQEFREERQRCKAAHDDHEDRLRTLEGKQSWSIWRDIIGYFGVIGAGIAGWFNN